jgi:hypothetical protein
MTKRKHWFLQDRLCHDHVLIASCPPRHSGCPHIFTPSNVLEEPQVPPTAWELAQKHLFTNVHTLAQLDRHTITPEVQDTTRRERSLWAACVYSVPCVCRCVCVCVGVCVYMCRCG